MGVTIKTYEEILGNMVRKMIADGTVNDVNEGSVLLTLLEAAAQNDFENNASILNVLDLLNINSVRDADLDERAADYGLTRIPARRASGTVQISDSSITKRSTGLYQVKNAPIAGSTKIFVNDASEFSTTGEIYIGRGTRNFEGPIAYTNIIDNGSFYTIELASALQNDHLISEIVVDAQGTIDRIIASGTAVQIPANNRSPAIEYQTLRDAVLPAGEDTITDVPIISNLSGSTNNAGINTIVRFVNPPFTGATVTNTTALTDGRDAETDSQLRERIKDYTNTLARGTEDAILSSIIGISDPTENKQVASATIIEPPEVGDPSIVYIDDGSGFEPSYAGQSVDTLVKEANGDEEFLQLANYPLPRAQSVNTADGPYELTDGSSLRVKVDDIEESIIFSDSDFSNISSATVSEVIVAINDQAETFAARFTENSSRILLYPLDDKAETIQVSELRDDDDESLYANSVLKFPTDLFSHIKLYQNNVLLRERERAATLQTAPFSTWNITTSGNLSMQVDGTPIQDRTFDTSDFNGQSLESLQLQDWVDAFNAKFAGLTATATSSGRMQIVSNKEGADSSIEAIGGDYFDIWFTGQTTSDTGQNSEFELNRQTGNLRILTDIAVGDSITAGAKDVKGSITSASTSTGAYNVSTDSDSRPAELITVSDSSTVTPRSGSLVANGQQITITDEGSDTMRIMSSSLTAFKTVQPLDFVYIASRGALSAWIDPANSGLYKIIAKGEHTTAGTDSYIEVKNVNIVPGVHNVIAAEDIQFFKASVYPQLWSGTFTTTPASATIQDIVDSFNENLINIESSIFKTNSIKNTSSTEDGGSFAIPVSIGNATTLFPTGQSEQEGNPSHIANVIPDKDAISLFKRTAPTQVDADGVTNKTVWLDRWTYSTVKGANDTATEPGEDGVDTYSDIITDSGVLVDPTVSYDDIFLFSRGNNEGHYRSVRDILAGDQIGTQHELPRTLLDHPAGEEFGLFRPVGLSAEDSIIFILDQDSVNKTIDISMYRTGRINTDIAATDISFSADDVDNEDGVTFGTLEFWDKDANNTEFQDYAVWMKARNWYQSGGATSGGGAFLLRAAEWGLIGEKYRFSIEYPSFPNQSNSISHANTPSGSQITYVFGSDVIKPLNLSSGDKIQITSPSADVYRYNFQNAATDLSTVVADDILSIRSDAGLSAANSGQFSILSVDDFAKTIDVYNPNGQTTYVGNPEVTDIQTVDNVIGSPTVSVVGTTAEATFADGDYFILEDSSGTVGIVYNKGAATPGASGADRELFIPLAGGETDVVVAALTAGVINGDIEFSALAAGPSLTITNAVNGAFAPATDSLGNLTVAGFSFAGATGTADVSVDGTYFILEDVDGTVAFWYDVTGVTPEPLHGADRSIEIATVGASDNASTIATKTAVLIAGDAAFSSAIVAGDTITVTDAENGVRTLASAGTSGFTVTENTAGTDDVYEVITITTSFQVFSLTDTMVSDIVTKVSESDLVNAVAIGDDTLDIVKATRDETYTPAGVGDYSVSLSYGHDPDPLSGLNGYIGLYDGKFFVKDFQNTNPHFSLKSEMLLQGIAPTVYSVDTAPNFDSVELGEEFRLVPVTLNNLQHHFTQKALSQLPIVADIDIAANMRRVQVKSKLLGSQGAVEIVGGNANSSTFSIAGEAQETLSGGNKFLEAKIAAFPATLAPGDVVSIENTNTTRRLQRLEEADSIDVFNSATNEYQYRWNPKATNINEYIRFTVTDVSATYSRAAGTVWRWQHNDGGSVYNIVDLTTGVPGAQADDSEESGFSDAPALEVNITDPGTGSTNQSFSLTVSSFPTQADYYTFESADGTTFAVWFDIDAAGTAPTGTSYDDAAHKIEVDILSSDTEEQVISKLADTLGGDVNFLGSFSGGQTLGTNFDAVNEGDILVPFGTFASTWSAGNIANTFGTDKMGGFPIIAVNSASRYVDVVNVRGEAMTDETIGTGAVHVVPTPSIEWKVDHAAKVQIVQVNVSGGTATVTTEQPHGYRAGDTITIDDNGTTASDAQPITVVSVIDETTFTYTSGAADNVYLNGNAIDSTKTETRYRLESLGFNNMLKLQYVGGQSPRFIDVGVAVDDFMTISGNTFLSNNRGRFRVIAVDNESVVFENNIGTPELHTTVPFNNLGLTVNWTTNSDLVTGLAGSFKNLSVGDWVKKPEDEEVRYLQVIAITDAGGNPVAAEDAVRIQLGDNYTGTSSAASGISYDQNTDVNQGVILDSIYDIRFHEGDTVVIGDTLFIDDISDSTWFNSVNSGSYSITEFGMDSATGKPYVTINNLSGTVESGVELSDNILGFAIIEGENNKYSSYRVIEHLAIDSFNSDRRVAYLTPSDRSYKMSQSNATKIVSQGKVGYQSGITTGIDGYLYYTGLLRTVQRTIDGYEPDRDNFPGKRSVGGIIETLPPLPNRISVSIDVTTAEGVNLNEITNDISSTIIDYVNNRGVGEDVILSDVIVRVMNITGVEAVTFTSPDPSTERIAINDNEKASITPQSISIS